MLSKLRRTFVSGFVSFFPVALSIYVILVGVSFLENLLGQIIRKLLPEGAYIPGFGFLATVAMILLIGFLVNNFITAAFFKNI